MLHDAVPSHVRHILYLFNLQITCHDPVGFNCWMAHCEQVAEIGHYREDDS